jgi:biopolymer transport protein ExbB/TolQ
VVVDNFFSFKNIFQVGGWVMQILGFCSVLVVAVIIERAYIFSKFSKELKKYKETLNKNPESKNIELPIISNLIHKISPEEIDQVKKEKIHFANVISISSYLDKNLPILATIGSMAPFIGLFGTVIGIIKAFKQLSIQKGAGIDVVGIGIAEALVCTAAGLFVAIVSVIFYNLFKTKAKRFLDEYEIFAQLNN